MPGVYLYKDANDTVLYVGKAKSLRDRVSSYFSDFKKIAGKPKFFPAKDALPKTVQLIEKIDHIDHIVVESEIDALIFEANLIRKLQPKYNVNWKDGKSYPLIEITLKEKIPQVHSVHHETNPKATYFGPYTAGSDIFSLLRFLRRLFPFVSQAHPGNRPCLRSHLGLCPCPGVFIDEAQRKIYLKNLKNMRDFLLGKRKTVQKRLEKEMLKASSVKNFERAAEIKKQLERIALVTANRTQAFEYETNPNLTTDQRENELDTLATLLNIGPIQKIECYDISNTSGKNATGAQVTFVDAVPDKGLYRRYKIKFKTTPDDFAMLEEVLKRRLHSEISLPELFVIDGGKGQLAIATKVLKDKKVKVISLAKRLETIFTDDGQEINLQEDSPALHLLQKMRDEAHRFSRSYHFLLRKRAMLS